MSDLGIFKKVWGFYLEKSLQEEPSSKKASVLKDIQTARPHLTKKTLSINSEVGLRNVLIIYSSSRLVPINLMEKAVRNFQKIQNIGSF